MATPYRSPDGDLAYRTDAWTREVYDSEVNMGGALASLVETTRANRRDAGQVERLHREVFGRLYGIGSDALPEEAMDESARAWAPRLHAEAAQLPEWRAVEAAASGDAMLASLATATIGEVLRDKLPSLPEPREEAESERRSLESLKAANGGKLPPDLARQLRAAERRINQSKADETALVEWLGKNAASVRSALRVATAKASEAIKESEAACEALGALGVGTGSGRGVRTQAERSALTDERMRSILAMAGRFKREMRARRAKGGRGSEELHSVELGADLGRLLPSELGLLGLGETGGALLYSKLVDRRALQYAVRGNEKPTAGPIVIAIDESGSMKGERDAWAKACALGLMMLAREQGRPFAVVHFDAAVTRIDRFYVLGASMESIIECVCWFSGGGTRLHVGLHGALDVMRETEASVMRKADVVIVSDGQDADGDLALHAADAMREMGASLYGIAIGCDFDAPLLVRMEGVQRISEREVTLGVLPGALLSV